MTQIIGYNHLGQRTEMEFRRLVGTSVKVGLVVTYRVGQQFQITAHRLGVEITGRFPTIDGQGADALIEMIRRAVKHHEHLKSYQDGARQDVLDERMLSTGEAADKLAIQ